MSDIKYKKPHRPNFTGTEKAYHPSSYVFQKYYDTKYVRPASGHEIFNPNEFLEEEQIKEQK